MTSDNKGFAARWSKRKAEARQETDLKEQDVEEATLVQDQPEAEHSQGIVDPDAPDIKDAEMLTEADFDDVDFEALDKSSDYTRFIQANVPEEIQKKALRKLWDSDSVFEVLDGMNDYDEDFTGDGLAGKVFKSAYKVGRGFMTDEDDKKNDDISENEAIETVDQVEDLEALPSKETQDGDEDLAQMPSEQLAEQPVKEQPDKV